MLKNIDVKKIKLILIFVACFVSIGFGLSDWDYFWQCDLGEAIIKHGNFNATYDLMWGEKGLGEYYDHEWLSNVIFYLFDSMGQYGIVLLKFAITLFVAITVILFIKKFNKSLDNINGFLTLVCVLVIASICFKVKAYTISLGFEILEILMLYEYKENKNLFKSIVKSSILVILWNNMHSGSVPLYFVIACIFFITELWFDKNVIVIGLINAIELLINPYGYKLILFDFLHNGNKVMKKYNDDWQPFNTNNTVSVILFILFAITLLALLLNKKEKNKFNILLFMGITFISLGSVRLIIYMLPVTIIALNDIELTELDFSKTFYIAFSCLSTVMILSSFIHIFTMDNFKRDYLCLYIDDNLADLIKVTNEDTCDGLLNEEIDLEYYDLKMFFTSGYPSCEERVNDTYYLNFMASDMQKQQIIDYYGLSKFVVKTLSVHDFYKTKGTKSNLYDYLNENDNYVKLYESPIYSYFVTKEIYNKNKTEIENILAEE